MLGLNQPIVGGIPGRIACRFRRPALAAPEAGVIEYENRLIHLLLPMGDGLRPPTQVARIAMTIEQSSLFRAPTGHGTPPTMDPGAVGNSQFNVLNQRIGRRLPVFAGKHRAEDQLVFEK